MIFHMLCLLMMVMMLNSVTCAPGQLNAINDIAQVKKNKSRPSSYCTLDPLGGGHLLRADSPFIEVQNFKSHTNYKEDVASVDKPSQQPLSSGTLDPIGGGNLLGATNINADKETLRLMKSPVDNQNMMRLAREDKSIQRSLHALDNLGGGRITGLADPSKGQVLRSLDRSHLVDSFDQGGDVIRMLDSISGSELLSSLDSAEGMAVLSALMKTHNKHPKRMLDSVSGWSFGESKRNFDEIDNVGFTGFAKRSPHRSKQLALAKKNFDEIDRAGFETYNKRDFDEIDRAGFETFEKRDRKE